MTKLKQPVTLALSATVGVGASNTRSPLNSWMEKLDDRYAIALEGMAYPDLPLLADCHSLRLKLAGPGAALGAKRLESDLVAAQSVVG